MKKTSKAVFKNNKIRFDVSLLTWEEEGVFYHYIPELEVVGYGNTSIEAKSSYEYQLLEFLTYATNKKTLLDELKKLGWQTDKRKTNPIPPSSSVLLAKNETYKDLINLESVHASKDLVELPL